MSKCVRSYLSPVISIHLSVYLVTHGGVGFEGPPEKYTHFIINMENKTRPDICNHCDFHHQHNHHHQHHVDDDGNDVNCNKNPHICDNHNNQHITTTSTSDQQQHQQLSGQQLQHQQQLQKVVYNHQYYDRQQYLQNRLRVVNVLIRTNSNEMVKLHVNESTNMIGVLEQVLKGF